MLTIGVRERPRALFEGLPDDVAAALRPMFGSVRVIESTERVDESEFDILVTGTAVHRSAHLHVLAFGADSVGRIVIPIQSPAAPKVLPSSNRPVSERPTMHAPWVAQVADVVSEELAIPEGVAGTVRDLIQDTLIPWVVEQHPRPRWRAFRDFHSTTRSEMSLTGVRILLATGDLQRTLAFMAHRADNTARPLGILLALPVLPSRVEEWGRWFLEEVRAVSPHLFPRSVSWQADSTWTPDDLRAALDSLEELTARRQRIQAELEADELRARGAVGTATRAAEQGIWKLVTAQGEDLVTAVVDAFQFLGFDIQDSDALVKPGSPRMEDLQVRQPSAPEWVALCEVKGYTKGASPKGVIQLTTRPVQAFVAANQRSPSALWFVANQWLEEPPDRRPSLLGGDPVVDLIAGWGGAVIDTVDLLRALVNIQAGRATADEVALSLLDARGRWSWPGSVPDAPVVTRRP
ncbi:hypothetical protein [Cellulomonas sp. Root137]|uniref:hypothetical protein n=1 Tax=Cellulomonas sp. Root137 TaxID=1736459 RepID=UPI00070234BB|nr:hypothetical protein [Cellulomonas sp. Root137]KQY41486.1 hypothetical protein ASD18_20565 [Cellulomonas sp. Root137]